MSIDASSLLLVAGTSEAHVQREPTLLAGKRFPAGAMAAAVTSTIRIAGFGKLPPEALGEVLPPRLQPDCNRTGLHWLGRGGTRLDLPAANAVQERTEWDRRRQAGTRLSELQNRDRRFESARRLLPF